MAKQALILTEKDILEIDLTLVRLLKESEAKCALLVDQDGRMLARKGYTKNIDCDSLAALLAGSFASNRKIAELVGERDFTIMFQQGKQDSIQNNLVDDDTILCVIFDDRTTVGMVRVYARDASEKVAETLARARSSNDEDDSGFDFGGVDEGASDALDDLFGDGDSNSKEATQPDIALEATHEEEEEESLPSSETEDTVPPHIDAVEDILGDSAEEALDDATAVIDADAIKAATEQATAEAEADQAEDEQAEEPPTQPNIETATDHSPEEEVTLPDGLTLEDAERAAAEDETLADVSLIEEIAAAAEAEEEKKKGE